MEENIKVESSVIKAIGYDETRQDLSIYFESGKCYIYTPVSLHFWAKVKEAESTGKFFNKNIKNNEAFTCLKFIR